MKVRKLTSEERLKRIWLHKIIVQIIIALSVCGFIAVVVLNNLYPEMDNWISRHGYSITMAFIAQGIVQLIINKRWSKNPELYDQKPDERDKAIIGIVSKATIGIYFLIAFIATIITTVLAAAEVISIWITVAIIANMFLLSLIMIIADKVVKRKY